MQQLQNSAIVNRVISRHLDEFLSFPITENDTINKGERGT